MVGNAVFGAIASLLVSPVTIYHKLWDARQRPASDVALSIRQRTGRYNAILDYSGELWTDEKNSPPASHSPVFFDWLSMLPREKVPSYAHSGDPSDEIVAPTYCKPREDASPVVDEVGGIDAPRYNVPRDSQGFPLSPVVTVGKSSTGVRGRGVLRRWGPNLAGSAVITRRHAATGKLQVVLIKRTDGSEKYAFPGGKSEGDEAQAPERTIIREFLEEAMDFHGKNNKTLREGEKNYKILQNMFGDFSIEEVGGKRAVTFRKNAKLKYGELIYAGYVHDDRNTDNAWVESVFSAWHLEGPDAQEIELTAGDDAEKDSAAFYDVVDDPRLKEKGVIPLENLFAEHSDVLRVWLEKRHPDDLPPKRTTAAED